MEQEKAEESEQMEMLELLRKALKRLKEEHPYEYGLVNKYYFSDRKVTMRELGEENNITKQAVNNSLNRAYERLKKYIIMYKEESDKIASVLGEAESSFYEPKQIPKKKKEEESLKNPNHQKVHQPKKRVLPKFYHFL